ncbi:MAG: hypothetical protein NZO16_02360 [Deltaproteobacteria bacterium]|nr:hypothetical protein [Deltaproteobacteria bacterium]
MRWFLFVRLFTTVCLPISLAFVNSQSLCKKNSNGNVKLVNGANCPSGHSHINNSISFSYLKDNSVTTSKIANLSVTSDKIQSVDWSKVDTSVNKIAGNQIANQTITAQNIAPDSLTGAEINESMLMVPATSITGSISSTQIANDSIDSSKVANDTLTNADFSSNPSHKLDWSKINTSGASLPFSAITSVAIDDSHIVTGANIDGSKIAISSIPWNRIQSTSLNISGGVGNPLVDDSVESIDIKNGTITDTDISNSAGIAFSKINAAGQITDSHISASANIDWSKISTAVNKIQGNQIGINTISSGNLQDYSVTNAKLANSSVVGGAGGVIQDSSITQDDLANGSVAGGLGGVIQDGTITNHDISASAGIAWSKINATGQITDAHIASSASISWSKINSTGQITNADVSSSAAIDWSKISTSVNKIQGNQIAVNTITSINLQDDSVSTGKIQNNAVTSAKIAPNSINASHIPVNSIPWDRIQGATLSVSGGSDAQIVNGTITDVDISSTANISWSKIDQSSVVVTSTQLSPNSVDNSKIANGSVTNSKLSISLAQPMPFAIFVGRTSATLATTGTQFLFLQGSSAPQGAANLSDFRNTLGCKDFSVTVELGTAPGTGATRAFNLFNGTTQIGTGSCEITGTNTACAFDTSTSTPPPFVSLRTIVTLGTPAASHAYYTVLCKP